MKRVFFAFGILVCCNLNAQSPKTFATKTNALDNFTGYKVDTNLLKLSRKNDFGKTYWLNTGVFSDIVVALFQKNYEVFNPPQGEAYCVFSTAICNGDFNNDGYIDVFNGGAAFNGKKANLSFLIWNTSLKKYEEKNLINDKTNFIGNPRLVTPVYLNSDDYIDLVIHGARDEGNDTNRPEPVRLCLSDGKGGYDLIKLKLEPDALASRFAHEGGDVADVNGDSYPDLFVPAGSHSYIFWGTPVSPYFTNNNFAHFSSDTVNFSSNNGFGEVVPSGAGDVYSGQLADIDNDGKIDLLLGGSEDSTAKIHQRLFINQGLGRFNNNKLIRLPLYTTFPNYTLKGNNGINQFEKILDDLNSDGLTDIITLNSMNYRDWYILVYTQQKDKTFKIDTSWFHNKINYTSNPPVWKFKLIYHDFDGDGKKDISYEDASITQYTDSVNTISTKKVYIRKGDAFEEQDFLKYDPYVKYFYDSIKGKPNCPLSYMTKPIFSQSKLSFCSGDSTKIFINNPTTLDTLKWYYGTKSDVSNVTSKTFFESTTLYVTRTNTFKCVISSDTINLIKYSIPSAPFLSKDTTNHLISSTKFRNTWYKDGTILADTTQQISLLNNGYYTVKTMENNCISPLSIPYYYSSSFGKQQFVVKLKTYNFDVTNKNVTDSIHLNNALVRGQMVLYNVGKTQHLILNPNDRYYFPGYHFINKDGNWKFENMYNSLKMEGPYGYSIYDSLGNIAISSTGDEGRTVFGDLFSVKTSGDSLIVNKINIIRRPFSDVSTGDINKDGKMDIVSYGGAPPNNQITTFTQNNSGIFTYDSSILERGDQANYKTPSIGSRIAYSGYAVTVSNILNNTYPEIIRGQYALYGNDFRYGIAMHSYNIKSGVYDSTKLISSLGEYIDSSVGSTIIRVADLNNDGKKDLVVKFENLNGNFSGLQLFINDGKNNFIAGQSFKFPPNKWNDGGFVLEDVNQDGWVDILLSPISGTDFYINSSQLNDNTLGVKLQNSILLNNKGTFDFLKIDLSVFGPKPMYLKSNFINNQIKYVGFGFPDGNNGNLVLTAPSGAIKMYDFTVNFCNNLIKPTFNTSKLLICSGDSLKLSITNINKGDSLKWYYGTKSDLTNVGNKSFTDSTKLFVTRTDSLGCVISSDTVRLVKFATPSAPSLSRDTANFLLSGAPGTTWYKDGSAITDTAQKYKPTSAGSYTAKTTTNGCTSVMSAAYYYLVTDIINLSKDEFIKLAPNPFVNQLNFDFIVKGYQKLNIEVYDVATGSKVATQQNITAGTKIQLGQLARGTYIVRVTSNDNKITQQFKMVKL